MHIIPEDFMPPGYIDETFSQIHAMPLLRTVEGPIKMLFLSCIYIYVCVCSKCEKAVWKRVKSQHTKSTE